MLNYRIKKRVKSIYGGIKRTLTEGCKWNQSNHNSKSE